LRALQLRGCSTAATRALGFAKTSSLTSGGNRVEMNQLLIIYHAQWDMLGFPVEDETGGYLVFALFPKIDVQILDD
jgi:hypothetical protein